MHPVQFQIIFNGLELALDTFRLEVVQSFPGISVQPLLTVFCGNIIGNVNDIPGVVSVFRQRIFFAEVFKVSCNQ